MPCRLLSSGRGVARDQPGPLPTTASCVWTGFTAPHTFPRPPPGSPPSFSQRGEQPALPADSPGAQPGAPHCCPPRSPRSPPRAGQSSPPRLCWCLTRRGLAPPATAGCAGGAGEREGRARGSLEICLPPPRPRSRLTKARPLAAPCGYGWQRRWRLPAVSLPREPREPCGWAAAARELAWYALWRRTSGRGERGGERGGW